jgi:hypothetical protein
MATCTIIISSNSDNTLSATSTSASVTPYPKTTSLKAVMDWSKGVIFQTLVQGSVNVVGSD